MADLYEVRWSVVLEAESKEDAALQAAGMVADPGNTATIFGVALDRPGTTMYMIDTEGGKAEVVGTIE